MNKLLILGSVLVVCLLGAWLFNNLLFQKPDPHRIEDIRQTEDIPERTDAIEAKHVDQIPVKPEGDTTPVQHSEPKTGKLIGYIVAGILIFLGVLFLWAAFGSQTASPVGRLLVGGLLVLVLDLGRPDRLIVAMTTYNSKSIFAWNILLYTGFMAVVAVLLIHIENTAVISITPARMA